MKNNLTLTLIASLIVIVTTICFAYNSSVLDNQLKQGWDAVVSKLDSLESAPLVRPTLAVQQCVSVETRSRPLFPAEVEFWQSFWHAADLCECGYIYYCIFCLMSLSSSLLASAAGATLVEKENFVLLEDGIQSPPRLRSWQEEPVKLTLACHKQRNEW